MIGGRGPSESRVASALMLSPVGNWTIFLSRICAANKCFQHRETAPLKPAEMAGSEKPMTTAAEFPDFLSGALEFLARRSFGQLNTTSSHDTGVERGAIDSRGKAWIVVIAPIASGRMIGQGDGRQQSGVPRCVVEKVCLVTDKGSIAITPVICSREASRGRTRTPMKSTRRAASSGSSCCHGTRPG
jgi:hypothetical protein